MQININKKSWMVWLLQSTYDYKPNNLCKFFWSLVGAIIMLPFNFPLHILNGVEQIINKKKYNRFGDPDSIPGFVGFIIYAVVFLITIGLLQIGVKTGFNPQFLIFGHSYVLNFWLIPFIVIFSLLLAIGLVIVVGKYIFWEFLIKIILVEGLWFNLIIPGAEAISTPFKLYQMKKALAKEELKNTDYAAYMAKYYPPKKPNLIWEFLKAKKQKYCPLINYYDPKDVAKPIDSPHF